MREGILKAVANPPKIMWGRFLPVLVNIGIQFPIMFMFIRTWDINPLVFMTTLVAGHLFCIFLGIKEPHISSMVRAYGETAKKTVNLYKVKGNKFEP